MSDLRTLRRSVGISQFALSVRAGIPRAKLSAVEMGEISLTSDEEAAVRKVLSRAASDRSAQISAVTNSLAIGAGA
jgi:predicted transcriptional regulator